MKLAMPRHVPNLVIIGQAILSIALAAGIIILAVSNGSISRTNSRLINENTELIVAVHTSNITSCNADNQDRAESRLIIQSILDMPSMSPTAQVTPKLAAQQSADIKGIESAISTVYAPVNCAALYPDPKGNQ